MDQRSIVSGIDGFGFGQDPELEAGDTVAPVISLNGLNAIIPANESDYDIGGICNEPLADVVLTTLSTEVATTQCTSGTFSFTSLDLQLLPDQVLTFTVSTSDAAGNVGTDSETAVKDTTPPVHAYQSPLPTINQSNAASYSIVGTCNEEGALISGDIESIPFSGLCLSGAWATAPFDVSFIADGTLNLSSTAEDLYQNISAPVLGTVSKDTATPVPVLTVANGGYGNSSSADFSATNISIDDTVAIYSDSACATTALTSVVSTGTTENFSYATPTEGTYLFYYDVTDLSLNNSGCLGPVQHVEDQTAPLNLASVSMSSPSVGESTNDSSPIFSGSAQSAELNTVVRAYVEGTCADLIGDAIVQGDNTFVLNGLLAVDGSMNGLNNFFFQLVDAAGNTSACFSSSLFYTLEGAGLATLPKIAMVGNDSDSKLVSLEDNNQITWIQKSDPGNPIDLGIIQAGQIVDIVDPLDSNNKVDQGDIIESTKASYAITDAYGTAGWASAGNAGRRFTSYMYRYGGNTPRIYVAATSGAAFVQLKQDQNNDGDLETISFANIADQDVHMFAEVMDDGKPFQIESNSDVSVYYLANSGGYDKDARVLTPASNEIVGYSHYLTALDDDTDYTAYLNRSDATNTQSGTADKTSGILTGRTNKSSLDTWATRVVADKGVALLQIADGDGINAAPHLPVTMLATHYGIPYPADYVGFISLVPTDVDIIDPSGSTIATVSLSRDGAAPVNAPYSGNYDTGPDIPAGTRFVCTNPCYMMYDHEQADGPDETLMLGFTP